MLLWEQDSTRLVVGASNYHMKLTEPRVLLLQFTLCPRDHTSFSEHSWRICFQLALKLIKINDRSPDCHFCFIDFLKNSFIPLWAPTNFILFSTHLNPLNKIDHLASTSKSARTNTLSSWIALSSAKNLEGCLPGKTRVTSHKKFI